MRRFYSLWLLGALAASGPLLADTATQSHKESTPQTVHDPADDPDASGWQCRWAKPGPESRMIIRTAGTGCDTFLCTGDVICEKTAEEEKIEDGKKITVKTTKTTNDVAICKADGIKCPGPNHCVNDDKGVKTSTEKLAAETFGVK